MLSRSPVHKKPTLRPERLQGEGGYLLLTVAVFLLVILAGLGSYSFVTQRDARFKANYAAGQRLAQLAIMAHNYAQGEFYSAGTVEGSDLLTAIGPPDNFAFAPIKGTTFGVEVRGYNTAPVTGAGVGTHAPSAYIHLSIRQTGVGNRTATDTIAFLDGASSLDLSRVGIVNQDPTPNPTCDGSPIVAGEIHVIWGSEPTACLHKVQIALKSISKKALKKKRLNATW